MKILMTYGNAENGKSTLSDSLEHYVKAHGKIVRRISFADLLKFICKKYYGCDGTKSEENRTLYQTKGDDMRNEDSECFARHVKTMCGIFAKEGADYVIIDDLRYENEYKQFIETNYDVIYIYIKRPKYENHLNTEQRNHPSETALNSFPVTHCIYNNGSKSDLDAKARNLINYIEYEHHNKIQ